MSSYFTAPQYSNITVQCTVLYCNLSEPSSVLMSILDSTDIPLLASQYSTVRYLAAHSHVLLVSAFIVSARASCLCTVNYCTVHVYKLEHYCIHQSDADTQFRAAHWSAETVSTVRQTSKDKT